MEQIVTRILSIAPYEGMRTAMERIAESYPEVRMDVYTGDMEKGAAVVRENEDSAYDVIISRGGTAELIQKITDTPVVSVRLSVYDVLRAIKMAENYSKPYAVVGFPSITEPAHILCDLLRFNVDIVTIHSADDVEATLAHLKLGGYKMVVSDVITHTMAQQKGMDAFLITSGAESIHTAISQAIAVSSRYRQLRRENLFLRSITRAKDENTVILSRAGELCYFTREQPSPEQLAFMRARLPEIPFNAPLKFYQEQGTSFCRVTARSVRIGPDRCAVFHCQTSQVPMRSLRTGIRTFSEADATQLFLSSFYAISGAMGELDARLSAVARSRQPVMILGESGTGKAQIARLLYLRSPRVKSPFVTVDCRLMNDRSWDFLFNHYSSPLADKGNTVYFQHLEDFPEQYRQELLAVTEETDMTRYIRLLFSCGCREEAPLPETARLIASRLGCLTLCLPTLRSRADEIPSLASLYLSSLNVELGKQIIGFDPRAAELLIHYDWPNNYTQFKQILQELATYADASYIRGSAVSEILTREQAVRRTADRPPASGFVPRPLYEIIQDAVSQTLEAQGGNQTAAARELGISRTTLWRYLRASQK